MVRVGAAAPQGRKKIFDIVSIKVCSRPLYTGTNVWVDEEVDEEVKIFETHDVAYNPHQNLYILKSTHLIIHYQMYVVCSRKYLQAFKLNVRWHEILESTKRISMFVKIIWFKSGVILRLDLWRFIKTS